MADDGDEADLLEALPGRCSVPRYGSGRLNVAVRNTAISARVTLFSGRYVPSGHPDVIPSSLSCSIHRSAQCPATSVNDPLAGAAIREGPERALPIFPSEHYAPVGLFPPSGQPGRVVNLGHNCYIASWRFRCILKMCPEQLAPGGQLTLNQLVEGSSPPQVTSQDALKGVFVFPVGAR